MAQEDLQNYLRNPGRRSSSFCWADLGLILGNLGPCLALPRGGPGGILRQMLGFEGLILGCVEVKLWLLRFETGNLDAMLASNLVQRGNLNAKGQAMCFRELVCWG